MRLEKRREKVSHGRRFCFINIFSSKEECEYLLSLAKPHMKKLTVVDSATRGSNDRRV